MGEVLKVNLAREQQRAQHLKANNEELKQRIAWLERDLHDLRAENERLKYPTSDTTPFVGSISG